MFYSEAILSRRGPLAKVWLAAHMERKLSKTQTLQTDIEQSVDAIMGQEVELMALRLSGQLLLGVVRIYSRKAKYLLDDCNEALLKIKMAFRPGIVDMTEDQLAVNRNAITLQAGGLDLDVLLPDINWDLDFEDRPIQPQGQHVARVADITLATADDLQFDLDDPGYILDLGPSDGIGSQDYDFDLGLDFGDGDNLSAVEVGRDAGAVPRLSDVIGGKLDADGDLDMMSNRSRDGSEHPFGALDFGGDFDAMNVDLGLDFGDNREKTPDQTRSPSRASSPLTEGPQTPPPGADIATPGSTKKPKKQPKTQKQIIDSITELEDGPGARLGRGRNAGLGVPMTKDVSDILTSPHFLPRSSVVMRLLEIRDDPLAHFLPTTVTKYGTFFCAAPPGLAPQLAELFMKPVKSGLGNKRRGGDMDKGGNKKMRLDGETDLEDVEQGMRAGSMAPSIGLGDHVLRGSVGPGLDFGDQTAGMDDFQMDLGGDFDMGGPMDRGKSAGATDRSRMSTPAGGLLDDGEETYADLACPIAMFDFRPNAQSQTQGVEKVEEAGTDVEGKGYSKNTVKALGVIRKELMPAVDGQAEGADDKVLSFNRMSEKASRRAAASFFFELLVLGTRDCVKVTQSAPFENIEIRAKGKLWERQRHGSVARSVASSMGL